MLQDSDSSLTTIGPHWPSSYPEFLSPRQGKDEQQRIVWARLINQCSNLAKSLREQKERYEALRRELNPRTTQVESSHDPLYRDKEGRRTQVWFTPSAPCSAEEASFHTHFPCTYCPITQWCRPPSNWRLGGPSTPFSLPSATPQRHSSSKLYKR